MLLKYHGITTWHHRCTTMPQQCYFVQEMTGEKNAFRIKEQKKFRTQSKFYLYQIYIFVFISKCSKKWKWRNIRPSMVTHTRNACSAFNPFTVHTHSSEHTPGAVGSHLCCGKCGEQLGVWCLAQGHLRRGIEMERALDIHSPHLQFLPTL